MQQLLKIIDQVRQKNIKATSEDLTNVSREYLQILILRSIYRSKSGPALSFQGGTCLRICYDLKRYSEDLDFALDERRPEHDFEKLIKGVKKDLQLRNIDVDFKASSDKTVQKAFIKVCGLLETLGIAKIKDQKLHIKIEVDTNPVDIKYGGKETFFVSKYNMIFPIIKHDDETLFAGKVLAILLRPYRRGRDFYDLVWYLNRNTVLNIAYLNKGIRMSGENKKYTSAKDVFKELDRIVDEFEPDFIVNDVGKFLEDPEDLNWIRQYRSVYLQLREAE